jgi:hemoglobin
MDEFASLYNLIGGETGLRALVNRFYDIMDSSPEARGIRAFHAKSLSQSREKLFMFLSGWSGGPTLYVEKYGTHGYVNVICHFPLARSSVTSGCGA